MFTFTFTITFAVHFLKFCRMRGYSERLIRRVIALNGGPFNRYRELILALHDAQELEEMDDEVIPESVQESVPEPEPSTNQEHWIIMND